VDYTKIRYVRKPKGSPAGYVIYTNQKTLYADPLDIKEVKQGVKICLPQ
jgi:predicted ribosome quality control (RQC) complex YloA/Tae2 family protein